MSLLFMASAFCVLAALALPVVFVVIDLRQGGGR